MRFKVHTTTTETNKGTDDTVSGRDVIGLGTYPEYTRLVNKEMYNSILNAVYLSAAGPGEQRRASDKVFRVRAKYLHRNPAIPTT